MKTCIGCGRVLHGREVSLGVCSGCTQPERLEALIEASSDGPLKNAMLRVGRNMGIVAGGSDE